MKQLKYILSTFVLLVPVLLHAQTDENPLPIYSTHQYNRQNGIATGKSVSAPDENGVYTLTLETFATGVKTIVNKAIPSDIVLVLDYSSSMLMNGNVGANPNNQWYSGTGNDGLPNVRDYLYSLKIAVGDFVKLMQANNETLDLAPGQMGNRIAVVLFAGQVYGEGKDNQSGSGNFYARHLSEFIEVDDMEVVSKTERHPLYTNAHQLTYASAGVMYDDIDIISPSSYRGVGNAGYNGIDRSWDIGDVNKGTRTGDAMEEAARLVTLNTTQFPYTERSTTVVMFTDGEPSRGSGFSRDEANLAISQARGMKSTTVNNQETDSHVKVFTVGLLNDPDNVMKTYLEYVSSDFSPASEVESQQSSPNALPNNNYLNPTTDYGPYSSIVSEGADLSGVFQTIANASGGSTASIPGETQVLDAVSSSFEIPSNFQAEDVTIYTRSMNVTGDDWENRSDDFDIVTLPEDYDLTKLPPSNIAAQIAPENTVGVYLKDGKLVVIGFDYSKADSEDAYDGNWVGWREGDKTAAGKELVIEFNVEAIEGVTGGDGTNTNSPESGVLVPTFDKDGNFTGYVNQINYPYPQTDLPINIEIHKEGLNHGESATIQIYRAPQKIGKFDPVTGKPAPDVETDDDWENFSKVILTNKEDDGETVIKKLVSLDPSYVYRLVEDDWGFGYYLDTYDINTSEKEANPFVFTNTKKATGTETTETTVVKHAEAVSINHFGQSDPDKRVENYKSNEEFDKK